MRGGMTENEKRVGIFFGEDLQLNVVIERAPQIDQFAGAVIRLSYTSNESRVGKAR
jgi:hypothetical protein